MGLVIHNIRCNQSITKSEDLYAYLLHQTDHTVGQIALENPVTILREGDLEQFGIYFCKHYGTVFKSIDEQVFHERNHYFV